jgi:hypothetical protein
MSFSECRGGHDRRAGPPVVSRRRCQCGVRESPRRDGGSHAPKRFSGHRRGGGRAATRANTVVARRTTWADSFLVAAIIFLLSLSNSAIFSSGRRRDIRGSICHVRAVAPNTNTQQTNGPDIALQAERRVFGQGGAGGRPPASDKWRRPSRSDSMPAFGPPRGDGPDRVADPNHGPNPAVISVEVPAEGAMQRPPSRPPSIRHDRRGLFPLCCGHDGRTV